MNKFLTIVSNNGNETLIKRAEAISTAAEIAQQNLVNALKQKKVELDLKIESLTDLAPDSKESLRPASKDWDAAKWADQLQTAKQELYFLEIQLKIATETYDEYFKEKENNSTAE